MTQEVKPVTRGALELPKLLQNHGSVSKEEVRAWLAQQYLELTASDIKAYNFAFQLDPGLQAGLQDAGASEVLDDLGSAG